MVSRGFRHVSYVTYKKIPTIYIIIYIYSIDTHINQFLFDLYDDIIWECIKTYIYIHIIFLLFFGGWTSIYHAYCSSCGSSHQEDGTIRIVEEGSGKVLLGHRVQKGAARRRGLGEPRGSRGQGTWVPGLVNTQKTMEITIFHGKSHYFYGHFQ